MKIKRKIIEIDEELCNGCGQCVPACEEGAIEIINGKAKLVAERYCDGLGACLGECPQGALKIVERVAEDFDEEAVEERLKTMKEQKPMACGCPSTMTQSWKAPKKTCEDFSRPTLLEESALSHWPIQLRLVNAEAPFLNGADLLIASDCTVAAYPAFHQEMLPGKILLMGCPKFDDISFYKEKLIEIFKKNSIRSVTNVIMEVPCCSGMPRLVEMAMEEAGVSIPTNTVVIGIRGQKLSS